MSEMISDLTVSFFIQIATNNLIIWGLFLSPRTLHKLLLQSVYNILSNVAKNRRQTKRQTDKQTLPKTESPW